MTEEPGEWRGWPWPPLTQLLYHLAPIGVVGLYKGGLGESKKRGLWELEIRENPRKLLVIASNFLAGAK